MGTAHKREKNVIERPNLVPFNGWVISHYTHIHTHVYMCVCVCVCLIIDLRLGRSAGEGICYPLQYSWSSLVVRYLQCGRPGFNPWVGKILWRRDWLTSVFWPGEFHGQRGLAGYSPWGCKELDTTEQLSLHFIHTHTHTTSSLYIPLLMYIYIASTSWLL